MKVTPIATIKNGEAAIAILAKFLKEKKLGFRAVKKKLLIPKARLLALTIEALGFLAL